MSSYSNDFTAIPMILSILILHFQQTLVSIGYSFSKGSTVHTSRNKPQKDHSSSVSVKQVQEAYYPCCVRERLGFGKSGRELV